MSTLLIARITHAYDDNHRSRWTVTLAHPDRDPFLTYTTGNTDEATEAPESLGEYFGYSPDEIEIRHLY
jgi:hypothetical protein